MVLVIGTTEMLFEKLQVLIYVTASFKKLSKFEKKKTYLEIISSLVCFCVSPVVSPAE